jgi:hypothetical protein
MARRGRIMRVMGMIVRGWRKVRSAMARAGPRRAMVA